jgi:hypothetical protein
MTVVVKEVEEIKELKESRENQEKIGKQKENIKFHSQNYQ